MKNSTLRLELEIESLKKDIDIEIFFINDLKKLNEINKLKIIDPTISYANQNKVMNQCSVNNIEIVVSEKKIIHLKAKIITLENRIYQHKNLS